MFLLKIFLTMTFALFHLATTNLVAIEKFLKLQPKPNFLLYKNLCWPKKEIHKMIVSSPRGVGIFDKESQTAVGLNKDIFILIDMSCPGTLDFLKLENHTANLMHQWIILIEDHFDLPLNLNFFLNSRVYLFEKGDFFYVKSFFRRNGGDEYFWNEVAYWQNGSFSLFNPISDYYNRSNQHLSHISVSMVLIFNESKNHLSDNRDLTKDPLSKANFILVNHMIEILNATMDLLIRNSWGTKSPNSTLFDGMTGDLQAGRAELSGTVSFFAKERIQFMDYVAVPIKTEARFIFRAPSLSKVQNILTLPLDIWVWLSLFILLILIFFVMLTIVNWEWTHLPVQESRATPKPGIMDIINLELRAVCQQGAEADPNSLSGRIVTFHLFLAFLFVYTAYSAYIVALLQTTTNSISNLDSLLKSKMALGADNAPYSKYTSSKQPGELRQAVLKKTLRDSGFIPPTEGVEKMRHNFFAFHVEKNTAYRLIAKTFLESEKCGLAEIKYWIETFPYLNIRKRSPYKEIVKIGYARLNEHGIQSRIYKKFYMEKPKCTNSGAVFRSVSFSDSYFAFVCYGTGTGIAVVILLVEKFFVTQNFFKGR